MCGVKKVGLIINPIAGVGGKAGLKGSDGEATQKEALAKGIKPESPDKAMIALETMQELKGKIEIYTYEGKMGQEEAEKAGFPVHVTGKPETSGHTTSTDTEKLARALVNENMDLILFAGGDGTARNVYRAVGDKIPVIGIPAGVKIHSGVYAINPKGAGRAANQFLEGKMTKTKEAEVMDLDEELYRKGVICPKLYGYMAVPDNKKTMQNVKMRSVPQIVSLDYIATDVVQSMQDDVIYIIGAGTTTRNIMKLLGLEYTLIGVDAVCCGKLIGKDLDEQELWSLIQDKPTKLVITAIGGQGHIFGRGNQQISPRIIRKIGMENISIVATKEKLLSLPERRLLTDTGDPQLDRELAGYVKVITGLNERTICAVGLEE